MEINMNSKMSTRHMKFMNNDDDDEYYYVQYANNFKLST